MKKILVVDNTFDLPHGSPEICAQAEAAAKKLGGSATVEFCRAPEGAIPLDSSAWDAVILSGSKTRIYENAPWIEQEIALIKKLYREKIPTLGICYGEQLIIRALAGSKWEEFTGASKISEYGWGKITLTAGAKKSAVFSSLPQEFYSYCMHSDEVYKLPTNFSLVAKSEDCAVQAYDLLDAPMWAVQFHPERTLEAVNKSLDAKKIREPGVRILGRDISDKVFSEKIAADIFHNFLAQVWKSE